MITLDELNDLCAEADGWERRAHPTGAFANAWWCGRQCGDRDPDHRHIGRPEYHTDPQRWAPKLEEVFECDADVMRERVRFLIELTCKQGMALSEASLRLWAAYVRGIR